MNIIIDTNVLVSAMKSSLGASYKLLADIDNANGQLQVSTPLVLEYEAILKREIAYLSHDDIESLVDYLCLIATSNQIFYLWRPVLNDPKDDHILELAVKVNAAIVTWSTKDFKLAKTKFGLEVLTPTELLLKQRILK